MSGWSKKFKKCCRVWYIPATVNIRHIPAVSAFYFLCICQLMFFIFFCCLLLFSWHQGNHQNASTLQIFRLDGASAISQTVTRFSLDTRHVCRFHPASRILRCRQDRLHPDPEAPCSYRDRARVQAIKHLLHQVSTAEQKHHIEFTFLEILFFCKD